MHHDKQAEEALSQLKHLKDILASNQMGTWNLYIPHEGKQRLEPDDKMKEIMGFTADSKLSSEEFGHILQSRIHPNDKRIFSQYHARLLTGERAECTYRWYHPRLGLRYIRCGGVLVASTDDETIHLNGYHYDVTDQMTKEIRSNHIIQMLANTYIFINYIDLDEDTFVTYSGKEVIESDAVIRMLMSASTTQSVEIGLEEIVAEEFRHKMRTFMDFTTLEERMSKTNVIITEFVDYRGLWYETSLILAERHKDGTIKNLLWTVRSIENEKKIEKRRQKILDENIAANAAKTKFLQNMSHEIRTPLNALFGFAQLLGLPDGSCTPEEKEQYNSYIYNAYRMLEMLVSDIIDIADSEHGNYRIKIKDVVLNSTCKSALMSVEFRVPPGVRMYMTSDLPDDYSIKTDERRIQQVLINYLTNACKNTQQGEIHLHVSKTEHPGRITFSVTDTGRGIPPEKANAIFTRFTKLNQFVQGSGLGLSICQMIAEKLGGEVFLDTKYTNGARFVFVIDDKS